MEMSRATRILILKKELDKEKWVGSGYGLLQALTDSISEAELMEKVAEGMLKKKEYKQALIDIGNRIGSPVNSYSPETAMNEYGKMQQDIYKIVSDALPKTEKGSK